VNFSPLTPEITRLMFCARIAYANAFVRGPRDFVTWEFYPLKFLYFFSNERSSTCVGRPAWNFARRSALGPIL